MTDDFPMRTEDMPSEMGILLDAYPRDQWEGHPGFHDRTKHWLGAHQMFRRLAGRVRDDTQGFLDRDMSERDFAGRLSHFGGALVGNLHGHHGWEDHQFFPELIRADPRFEAGLEVLEKDHADLDVVLDAFTQTANRAIKLGQMDEHLAREEAGKLHTQTQVIEAFLQRHLDDEEELAVPIILHHRLRG